MRCVGALLVVAACGGQELAGLCEPGVPLACRCEDGREGVALCADDGRPSLCGCDAVGPADQSWSRAFAHPGDRGRIAVASSPRGIVVAGSFEGAIGFGGLPLESRGGSDAFVALLDPSGAHVWSRGYGSEADDEAMALAVDDEGRIYVVGYFSGDGAFSEDQRSAGFADGFVAALGADGSLRWVKSYGSERFDQLAAVAFDRERAVVVATGHFQGRIESAAGTVVPVAGTDVLVVEIGADGDERLIAHQGGSGDAQGYAIVPRADGTVQIGGRADGPFSDQVNDAVEGEDIFVLSLAEGERAALETYGGAGADRLTGMARVSAEGTLLAGHFQQTSGFGPGREIELSSAGGSDVFVVVLADDGSVSVTRRYGDAAHDRLHACEVASDGAVLLGGSFAGTVDFGDGPRTTAGEEDAFVAELDEDLALVRVEHWGDAESQEARSVAFDRHAPRFIVAGTFAGRMDIGGAVLESADGDDLFVSVIRR